MSKKGLITIRTVIAAIERETNQKRALSVPNPNAQTFDSCTGQEEVLQVQRSVQYALQHWKKHWPIMYKFAVLQIRTGARVSEILKLHSGDISPESRIRIHALKGSNSRVVQVSDLHTWLQSERAKNRFLFQGLNRFAIHREYVKRGLAVRFGKNSKRSTTHIFRHLVGLDLKQLTDPTHAIKIGLGQKTDASTDYYKAQIRRENNS